MNFPCSKEKWTIYWTLPIGLTLHYILIALWNACLVHKPGSWGLGRSASGLKPSVLGAERVEVDPYTSQFPQGVKAPIMVLEPVTSKWDLTPSMSEKQVTICFWKKWSQWTVCPSHYIRFQEVFLGEENHLLTPCRKCLTALCWEKWNTQFHFYLFSVRGGIFS